MISFRLYKNIAVFLLTVMTLLDVTFANYSGYTPCTSPICQETGEEIINSIDESIDPCEDFFQHACGGWMARHPVGNSDRSSDQLTIIEHKIEQNLKSLLETEDVNDTEAIRKAKDFYKTCVDLATIDSQGLQPLMAILTANGDWPLSVPLDQWNPQQLTWQQIHENFMIITEYSGLFDLTVEIKQTNSSARVITLKSLELPVERERLIALGNCNSPKYLAYNKYAFNVALKFSQSRGFNISTAEVLSNVTEMLNFEAELQKVSLTNDNDDFNDDSAYHITTIKKTQALWDSIVYNYTEYKIDWLKTIRKRFENSGIAIEENEQLAILPGIYVERLAILLSKTSIRTIVNYIHWYAIERLLVHGNDEMRELELQYLRDIEGIQKRPARWRTCTKYYKMRHAMSFMYVKKHFKDQSRASILEMIDQLREASKEMISKTTWMDKNVREMANDKIDGMVNRIGYPDWYDELGKVNDYYSELTIGRDYFENVLAANRFDSRKKLLKLRTPASAAEAEWNLPATAANAAYDDPTNSLNFPAGILQMPLFHHEKPAALRFGGIGAIIGHEIFHGFDREGRLRDKNGNMRPWWSNTTIDQYVKKTECFVKQYSHYKLTKSTITNKTIYVDGNETVDENLGDNAGFSMGFKAFQRYKSSHPNEIIKIPKLYNYSDEKLYFYGLANFFCDVLQPEFLEHTYPTIWYPPNNIRINGALSNMEDYAKTFGCSSGKKMNPVHKCILLD